MRDFRTGSGGLVFRLGILGAALSCGLSFPADAFAQDGGEKSRDKPTTPEASRVVASLSPSREGDVSPSEAVIRVPDSNRTVDAGLFLKDGRPIWLVQKGKDPSASTRFQASVFASRLDSNCVLRLHWRRLPHASASRLRVKWDRDEEASERPAPIHLGDEPIAHFELVIPEGVQGREAWVSFTVEIEGEADERQALGIDRVEVVRRPTAEVESSDEGLVVEIVYDCTELGVKESLIESLWSEDKVLVGWRYSGRASPRARILILQWCGGGMWEEVAPAVPLDYDGVGIRCVMVWDLKEVPERQIKGIPMRLMGQKGLKAVVVFE